VCIRIGVYSALLGHLLSDKPKYNLKLILLSKFWQIVTGFNKHLFQVATLVLLLRGADHSAAVHAILQSFVNERGNKYKQVNTLCVYIHVSFSTRFSAIFLHASVSTVPDLVVRTRCIMVSRIVSCNPSLDAIFETVRHLTLVSPRSQTLIPRSCIGFKH